MAREDEAFIALRAERLRRPRPDGAKLKPLEEAFKKAQADAQQYAIPNEFGEILDKEGAQGLNAFTSFDQTVYHYSLPSNKLALWAARESDRFTHPVLREFYKEKEVIMEEKRMGESSPMRRLLDDFVPVAYKASMYRSFVIGHMSDLQALTRPQVQA
jgi:predicted Zn-dependent peptidase